MNTEFRNRILRIVEVAKLTTAGSNPESPIQILTNLLF